MNKIALNQSPKKKTLILTIFVLYSLFILESVFALKQWKKENVWVEWIAQDNVILITTLVYDYSFGSNSEHGYLEYLTIEASVDKKKYFRLMDIATPRQIKSEKTKLYLKNKLENAQLRFLDTDVTPNALKMWPEKARSKFKVTLRNTNPIAVITIGWSVENDYHDIGYIRVSGIWQVDAPCISKNFENLVYPVHIPVQPMLKSIVPGINTKVYKNDTVKVINESEAIVVKGANLGSNIKVYTTSGAKIKSVISNNDVVKVKLPAKQFYIVHVGKSRYKVCL